MGLLKFHPRFSLKTNIYLWVVFTLKYMIFTNLEKEWHLTKQIKQAKLGIFLPFWCSAMIPYGCSKSGTSLFWSVILAGLPVCWHMPACRRTAISPSTRWFSTIYFPGLVILRSNIIFSIKPLFWTFLLKVVLKTNKQTKKKRNHSLWPYQG